MTEQLDFLEKAVLSACLIDEGACVQALELLKPEDFLSQQHAVIFVAIRKIVHSGLTADPVIVSDRLSAAGMLDRAGGMNKLSELVDFVPTAENAESYISEIRSRGVKRRLYRACDTIRQKLDDEPDITADEASAFAEAELLGIATDSQIKETTHIQPIVMEALDKIAERMYSDEPTGVHTGFRTIDRLTSGFQPGQLILVAGRPAMGKTSLAMNIAANAALQHDTGVVVFSLEMSEQELVERMLCSEARISASAIKEGRISEEDNNRLAAAAGLLVQAPIYINDSAGMQPLGVQSNLRRLMAKHDIGLVIVDYLQLMAGGSQPGQNLNAEMTRISRALKVTAKDFGVPVVALSQLNRSCESREDKRPLLSDLRDSGSLEQDADIVMFVYREEEYTGPMNNQGQDVRGKAEVVIRKHRGGPTGTVYMKFEDSITRFSE